MKPKVENMASESEELSLKRKPNTQEENEEPTKKQKLDLHLSEIEFKVKLRDDDTITSGLEDFITLAIARSDGVQCTDIVSRYVTSSPDCTELLGLLDITQKKLSVGQVSLVYECLTHILKYVQSDGNKFRSTGDTIIQRILSGHLGQMYNYIRDQNKSRTVKRTLQLLIAMVMHGDKAKKAVQSKFRFDHDMFHTLFQRRDRQDSEDVRSCLVLFAMSFIIEGDGELINAMVQQKGFIQMTLAGLTHDPKEMVLDVLATLLDKVVKNPDISKTAKIKLFNEKVLKQMCDLYEWEGPRGWRPKKDKKQSDAEKSFLTDENFVEERTMVTEIVHEFLLAMCSSQKHGIIFYDRTIGTGSKNFNQLLTHLLQSLSTELEHPLKRNLAAHILRACPDQLFHFLTSWSSSLGSRWSEKWALYMNFLVEIYENLPPVPTFLSNPDGMVKDVDSLITMMVIYYLPNAKIASALTAGVRNDDLRVRYHCLLLMQVIIQNVNAILSTISSNKLIHLSHMSDTLSIVFTSLVVKTLPSSATLFVCVEKVLEILSSPKKLEGIGVEVDLIDHVATILKTLKLYQSLCPNLLSERPKDVAKLVEVVGKLQSILDETMKDVNTDTDSKIVLPQLDLLKLLSETDTKSLSLGREGLLEKLLRSAQQCLKEKHKEETTSLVCKMLTSLDILSGYDKELHQWIDAALTHEADSSEKGSFSTIGFLSMCLCTLINNPVPYLDRVMEAVADVSSNENEILNTSVNDGLKDAEIKDILKMKVEDLDLGISDELLDKSKCQTDALPFSPLSLIALEKLQYAKGDTVDMTDFVSSILVKIVHTQNNPVPYSILVSGTKTTLVKGVREYFEYWGGKKKKQSKATTHVNLKFGTAFSCNLLNWYMSSDTDTMDVNAGEIPQEERLSCLTQTIFYMEHCHSPNFGLGLKLKKVKVLRKAIEDIFSCYMEELEEPMDGCSEKTDSKSDDTTKLLDTTHDKMSEQNSEVVHKMSHAFMNIANNATFKNLFLSCSSNDSSQSKAEKNQKTEQSISKLLCKVFCICKDFELSTTCSEIIEVYTNKALDCLSQKGDKDLATCLITIASNTRHIDLHFLTKCVSTLLITLNTSVPCESLLEKQMIQVHKGQLMQPSTPVMDSFLQLFDSWMKIIKPYKVVEIKDNSVLFAVPSKDETDMPKLTNTNDSMMESTQLSPQNQDQSANDKVWLDVSDLKYLFHFLPFCSNFDSIICSLVKQFPQLSHYCSTEVFTSLITHYTSCGNDRQCLVDIMISTHNVFHELGGNYLRKEIKNVIKRGHFSLLQAYMENGSGDVEILKAIGQKVLTQCKNILPSENEHLWAALHALVRIFGESDNVISKGLYSTVKSYMTQSPSSAKLHHFSLLSNINRYGHANSSERNPFEQKNFDFIELVLRHLIFLLSKKSHRNIDLEEKLVHFALGSLKYGNMLSLKFINSSWSDFFRCMLKHLYNKTSVLNLLSQLVTHVFKRDKSEMADESEVVSDIGGLKPQMMFEMCVSHTAFLPTLLSTSDIPTKEALVNLLFSLFEVEPSCMKKELINPFLSAYSASLSLTDQRLLKMMQPLLLDTEINNSFPVLWGKAYLDHKANTKTLGPSLDTEIALKVVLGEIDTGKMQRTILNFSLTRNTKELIVCNAEEMKSKSDCYDPSYLLRVFLEILSPDKFVQVRSFVAKDCLGFILICLTSYNLHCRLLAYKCLNEFYGHLENSGCPERHEFAFILDILNASRVQNGQKLSTVVALFLARAIKLMNDPSDHMYLPIIRFLMLKPEMDLTSVPEFYNLFFSARSQYAKERNWMISLLRDGIRDSSDYWLYQKRLIFRLLMTFYSSSVSDKTSQVLVLEMVRNTCYQKSASMDLISENGLISWLSYAVSGLQQRPEQTKLLCAIISTLCNTLGATDHIEKINTEAIKGNVIIDSDIADVKLEHDNSSLWMSMDKTESVKKDVKKVEGNDVTELGISKSVLISLDMLIKSLNDFLRQVPSIVFTSKHSNVASTSTQD